MTRTEWEDDIRNVFSTSISEALFRMSQEKCFRVKTFQTNERDGNKYEWALEIETPTEYGGVDFSEFWLGTFGTRKDVVAFCREMGWKIKSVKPKQ